MNIQSENRKPNLGESLLANGVPLKLTDYLVLIRGAGEMASGVAWRLF
jgi:hypothetical protein